MFYKLLWEVVWDRKTLKSFHLRRSSIFQWTRVICTEYHYANKFEHQLWVSLWMQLYEPWFNKRRLTLCSMNNLRHYFIQIAKFAFKLRNGWFFLFILSTFVFFLLEQWMPLAKSEKNIFKHNKWSQQKKKKKSFSFISHSSDDIISFVVLEWSL